MVRIEHDDSAPGVWTRIEGVEHSPDLFIHPAYARQVGFHRQGPAVVFLHPVMGGNLLVAQSQLSRRVGKIAPIVGFHHWKPGVIHAVVDAYRREERNVRPHEAQGAKERLVMFLF